MYFTKDAGFTVVELMIGMALVLLISLSTLSLWEGVERTGTGSTDRMVALLQSRVAVARWERDLRLASARDCLFLCNGAVLAADTKQVVFLIREAESTLPSLVEWELAGTSLMRRKGDCPFFRPLLFAHNLYFDNKTILEGLTSESELQYFVGGRMLQLPLDKVQLAQIDEIRLQASIISTSNPGSTSLQPITAVSASSFLGR